MLYNFKARLKASTWKQLFLTDRWGIKLHPCCIPEVAKVEANVLSLNWAVVEWQLWSELLCMMYHQWGPPKINVRISGHCVCSPIFFSIRHDLQAKGIDALLQPWDGV